jgi:hypothetical protein
MGVYQYKANQFSVFYYTLGHHKWTGHLLDFSC